MFGDSVEDLSLTIEPIVTSIHHTETKTAKEYAQSTQRSKYRNGKDLAIMDQSSLIVVRYSGVTVGGPIASCSPIQIDLQAPFDD